LNKFLTKRKQEIANGDDVPDDCLTAMIKEDMPKELMEDHYTTLVGAGHDTTAFFCAYMSYCLAKNPHCQDRLVAEIESHFGSREEVTADDTVQLKYLTKVMQETLRYYTIIATLTRLCVSEVHIKEANVTIPANTNVMLPMALINRDPDLWDEPSKFNPDRFDGPEFTSAKNGYFPFAYGSRTCIGNTLAQLDSAVFMIKLLRKYIIEPEPGFVPQPTFGISLTTLNGLRVLLKKRY